LPCYLHVSLRPNLIGNFRAAEIVWRTSNDRLQKIILGPIGDQILASLDSRGLHRCLASNRENDLGSSERELSGHIKVCAFAMFTLYPLASRIDARFEFIRK